MLFGLHTYLASEHLCKMLLLFETLFAHGRVGNQGDRLLTVKLSELLSDVSSASLVNVLRIDIRGLTHFLEKVNNTGKKVNSHSLLSPQVGSRKHA